MRYAPRAAAICAAVAIALATLSGCTGSGPAQPPGGGASPADVPESAATGSAAPAAGSAAPAALQAPSASAPGQPLKGASILMVVAHEGFRDEELSVPREVLSSLGASVTVASTETTEARGMLGARAVPDAAVGALSGRDFDAVVVVGGAGAPSLKGDGPLRTLIARHAAAGRVVAAICLGPVVLADAGVLSGRRATAFPSAQAELERAGASYTGAEVEADGRLVTANGPAAAEGFARAVADAIAEARAA